jgi:hypothetical protein
MPQKAFVERELGKHMTSITITKYHIEKETIMFWRDYST